MGERSDRNDREEEKGGEGTVTLTKPPVRLTTEGNECPATTALEFVRVSTDGASESLLKL